MSNVYSSMTVPQLRDEVRRVYTSEVNTHDAQVPATSKLRKAELIELLVNAFRKVTESSEVEAAANADLAGQIYGASIKAVFTPEERLALNEGKYRGRYEGKSVRAGRFTGTVVDRVHRDSDPLNRGDGSGLLLLAVRHATRPRVTLHRAEDVMLVS